MSDNIKVVVKVRPLIPREIESESSFQWRVKNNTLSQIDSNGKDLGHTFTFDKVYDEKAKTLEIYNDIARPIVEASIAGINGTIFAYGQTSSGKTYTMMGTEHSPGVIPLAVYDIFDKIKCIPDRDFLLRVSYIEIYNETIKDLLCISKEKIKLTENGQGVRVEATEKVASTPEEVLQAMKLGEEGRQVGTTNMNEQSSRSHTIFQITIESRKHKEDDAEEDIDCVNVSQLNLVDLAGSERSGQTGATGLRFKEGTHINKSLSTLGLVIKQLSEDPRKFINYRDSKLTRILQNSLGGNAKTSVICAVTPAAIEETISTLQFANRAKAIENKPEVNAVATNATMLQSLTKKLANLQYELENKKHVEEDNQKLAATIKDLQRQILNGFKQKDQSAVNRRRTWCAPRRNTLSVLSPIQENSSKIVAKARFATPLIKYNDLIPPPSSEYRGSTRPPDIPEGNEDTDGRITPPNRRLNVMFSNEIIEVDDSDDEGKVCSPYHKCYGSSKTPPCILRDKARSAERSLEELVELTDREKLYPPHVIELMERLEENTNLIEQLRSEIELSRNQCQEKDSEISILKDKISSLTSDLKSMTSSKEELESLCIDYKIKLTDMEIKLNDLEVMYDRHKSKSQTREKELLSRLEGSKTLVSLSTSHTAPKKRDNDIDCLINLSKDISLVSNESEMSVATEGTDKINDIMVDYQDDISTKNSKIHELEDLIGIFTEKISLLESKNQKMDSQLKVLVSTSELSSDENLILKQSVENLNSVITGLKDNLNIAERDIQIYNKLFRSVNKKSAQDENTSLDKSLNEELLEKELQLTANNEVLKQLLENYKLMSVVSAKVECDCAKDIEVKNKEISLLENEVQSIKVQIDRSMKEIQSLNDNNSELIKKNTDLLHKTEKLTEFEVIYSENETLKSKVDELLILSSENSSVIRELTDKCQQMNTNILNLETHVTAKTNTIEDLNAIIKKQKDEIMSMNELIEAHEARIKSDVDCKEHSNKHLAVMEEQNNTENAFKNDDEMIYYKANDVDKVNTELKVQKDAINVLTRKIFDILSALGSNIENDENSDLGDIKNLLYYFEVLESKVFGHLEDLKTLTNQNTETLTDLEKVSLRLQITQSNLESCTNSNIEKDTKIGFMTREIDALKTKLIELQEQVKITEVQLQDKVANLKEKCQVSDELKHNLGEKDKRISTLECEIHDLSSSLSMKEFEYTHLKNKLDICLEELGVLRNTTAEVIKLKDKIREKDNVLAEKENDLLKLSSDFHQLQNSIENKLLLEKSQSDIIINLQKKTEEITIFKSNFMKNYTAVHNILASFDKKSLPKNLDDGASFDDISASFNDLVSKVTYVITSLLNDNENLTSTSIKLHDSVESMGDVKQQVEEYKNTIDELNTKLNSTKNQYQIALETIDNLKDINKDLNNNLMETNVLVENLKEQLFKKIVENEDFNNQVQKLETEFKECVQANDNAVLNLNRDYERLRTEHLTLVKDHEELETKLRDMYLERNHILDLQKSNDLNQSLIEPPSLIRLSLKKIVEHYPVNVEGNYNILDNSELCNVTDISKESFVDEQGKEIETLLQENIRLKTLITNLESQLENEKKDKGHIFEEVKLLVEQTDDLFKQIAKHRTNLSTLTATTQAENKLLRSKVKYLQHHHDRLHNICQREIPEMRQQLKELLTILHSEFKYSPTVDYNVSVSKRDSNDMTDENNTLYKSLSMTLDGDMLMLQNITFSPSVDNSIIDDTTDFDMTLRHNDTKIQADEPKIDISSHMELKNLLDTKSLAYENERNILQNEVKELTSDIQKLSDKLNAVQTQNIPETCQKCNKDDIDILRNKLVSLEQKCESKSIEIKSLTEHLNKAKQQTEELQKENDILSTQLIDGITESDSLRDELIALKNKCSCSSYEKCNANCSECVSKTKVIKSLSVKVEALNNENNKKAAVNEGSSNSNMNCDKIVTLQNELELSQEDCKKITEEVATIRTHLERQLTINGTQTDEIFATNDPNDDRILRRHEAERTDLVQLLREHGVTSDIQEHTPITDSLKTLFENINVKHKNDIDNLLNNLKDIQEERDKFKAEVRNLADDLAQVNFEIDLKHKQSEKIAKDISKFKVNCLTVKDEFHKVDMSSDKIIHMLDFGLLETIDYDFASALSQLYDEVWNVRNNHLMTFRENYAKLKESSTRVSKELNASSKKVEELNENMMIREQEYNILKTQCERSFEINRAVTLGLVKKEQSLKQIIDDVCQKLLEQNIIKDNEIDTNISPYENLQKLFELWHIQKTEHQKILAKIYDIEREKDTLLTEVNNTKSILKEKNTEIDKLMKENEHMNEIIQTVQLSKLSSDKELHEQKEINEKLETKLIANETKAQSIEVLNTEIAKLQENLNQCESKISELEAVILQLRTEKNNAKEVSAQFKDALIDVEKIAGECETFKSANNILTTENNQIKNDLQLAKDFIKDNLTKQESLQAEISNLKQVAKQVNLEHLKEVNNSLIAEVEAIKKKNDLFKSKITELEGFLTKKCNEYNVLEQNIKTIQKTSQIQNDRCKRLQKEKEELTAEIAPKSKLIKELQHKLEHLQADNTVLRTKSLGFEEELNNLRSLNEILEKRVSELQEELDSKKDKNTSIPGSETRKRRQSKYDMQRTVDGDIQDGLEFTSANTSQETTPVRDTNHSRCHKENETEDKQNLSKAGRRRRQSIHDMHRPTEHILKDLHLNIDEKGQQAENHSYNVKAKDHHAFETEKNTHANGEEIDKTHEKRLQNELAALKKEYVELSDRYKELDDECETCAQYLREREEQCDSLKSEKAALELQVAELQNRLEDQDTGGSPIDVRRRRQSIYDNNRSKSAFVEAGVNTDEDWTKLHEVFVDRMTYDNVLEKNKRLLKTVEELKQNNIELKTNINKLQNSLKENSLNNKKGNSEELLQLKTEIDKYKQRYDELEERYKDLDEECETCAQYLREREEQCDKLKQDKNALEAKVIELQDSNSSLTQTTRKKRQSIHDQNRETKATTADVATNTNTDGALTLLGIDHLTYEAERDKNRKLQATVEELKGKNSELSTKIRRLQQNTGESTVTMFQAPPKDTMHRQVQHLNMQVESLLKEKAVLEQQIHGLLSAPSSSPTPLLVPQPLIVAGSAIVQNQQLCDALRENHTLRKMNAKLVKLCKKRGKTDTDNNRENEEPKHE